MQCSKAFPARKYGLATTHLTLNQRHYVSRDVTAEANSSADITPTAVTPCCLPFVENVKIPNSILMNAETRATRANPR